MANQLWAPLTISYWQHLQQVTVTLTTEVPCHLWLRWSWQTPLKHPTTRIVRGLPVFSDTYLCFTVYNDIEQNEVGDTLTHTFWLWVFDETTLERQHIYFYFWGKIYVPNPAYDWPFWEPWNTHLTQNNPWERMATGSQPVVTFQDGMVKVADTGQIDVGIIYYPPSSQLPLRSPAGNPLYIVLNSPEATVNDSMTLTYYAIWTTNGVEDFLMHLGIARGSDWDYLGAYWYGTPPPAYHNGIYPVFGPQEVDLLALWQKGRADNGLGTDPTGWQVTRTAYTLSVYPAALTEYVRSSYVGFCHPTIVGGRPDPPLLIPAKSPSETAIFNYIYHRRYDIYWPAWDAAWGLNNGWLQSQSFTPEHDHEFTKVHVHLAHRYDPCTIHAYLYRAGDDHAPAGDVLAIGSHQITDYHATWSYSDPRIYFDAMLKPGAGERVAIAYQEKDDTNQNFGEWYQLAQTFTPQENFYLFRVKLKVWQVGEEGPVYLSLYNTDAEGKPTGTPIATSQNTGRFWGTYSPGSWIRWDFYFPFLLAGTQYALVLSCPTAPAPWRLNARKDAGDATYPGGCFLLSRDSGASWIRFLLDDLVFIIELSDTKAAAKVPPTHLIKGTEYCIVLTQTPEAPAQTGWRGTTSGTYPRGIHSRHELAGYWEPLPATDLNFSEWGYPPLKE